MDEKTREKYLETVMKTAEGRRAIMPDFNEVDFFCGAMCIFINEKGEMPGVPAGWIMPPMAGRSIIDEWRKANLKDKENSDD